MTNSPNPFGAVVRCAMCQERIEAVKFVGRDPRYAHAGYGPYDHAAVRQRSDPQPYEPYDESEQDNGPVPSLDELMEVGIGNAYRSTPEDVTRDVPNYDAETAENPKVPLISTTEDYHGQLAEKLKVDVEVRQNTRLFLVYVGALIVVLLVATATYGLLQATPWPLSWWSCLALTLLFRIGVLFGRWRFTG